LIDNATTRISPVGCSVCYQSLVLNCSSPWQRRINPHLHKGQKCELGLDFRPQFPSKQSNVSET